MSIKQALITLIFGCSLSSCFDIFEKISFNEDHSGHAYFIADLSQSSDNIKGVLALQALFNKTEIPDSSLIKKTLLEFQARSEAYEGISNVVIKDNYNDYIFSMSLDFTNIQALNNFLQELTQSKQQKTEASLSEVFQLSNSSFKRSAASISKRILEKSPIRIDSSLLLTAKYNYIYSFPRRIKAVDNKLAKTSAKQNSVNYTFPFTYFFDKPKETGLEILF